MADPRLAAVASTAPKHKAASAPVPASGTAPQPAIGLPSRASNQDPEVDEVALRDVLQMSMATGGADAVRLVMRVPGVAHEPVAQFLESACKSYPSPGPEQQEVFRAYLESVSEQEFKEAMKFMERKGQQIPTEFLRVSNEVKNARASVLQSAQIENKREQAMRKLRAASPEQARELEARMKRAEKKD